MKYIVMVNINVSNDDTSTCEYTGTVYRKLKGAKEELHKAWEESEQSGLINYAWIEVVEG